jgi:hypothetical protein
MGHQQTKTEATIRWRPRSPVPSRPAVIGMFAVTVAQGAPFAVADREQPLFHSTALRRASQCFVSPSRDWSPYTKALSSSSDIRENSPASPVSTCFT